MVEVDGHLVGSSSADLEHVLRDLIEHQGNLDVVVDLQDVDHADPEGLAVLDAASQTAQEHGASLRWRDPPPAMVVRGDLTMNRAGHQEGQAGPMAYGLDGSGG